MKPTDNRKPKTRRQRKRERRDKAIETAFWLAVLQRMPAPKDRRHWH